MTVHVGGVLEPGHSTGTLTFDTSYGGTPLTGMLVLLETAETRIDLAGTGEGEFDRIELINGGAVLDGELVLSLLDGFRPDPTDVFDILVVDNAPLVGTFANVADGEYLSLATGHGAFQVLYLDDRVRLTNFVPEPTTLTLLAVLPLMTGRACGGRRRRRDGLA